MKWTPVENQMIPGDRYSETAHETAWPDQDVPTGWNDGPGTMPFEQRIQMDRDDFTLPVMWASPSYTADAMQEDIGTWRAADKGNVI